MGDVGIQEEAKTIRDKLTKAMPPILNCFKNVLNEEEEQLREGKRAPGAQGKLRHMYMYYEAFHHIGEALTRLHERGLDDLGVQDAVTLLNFPVYRPHIGELFRGAGGTNFAFSNSLEAFVKKHKKKIYETALEVVESSVVPLPGETITQAQRRAVKEFKGDIVDFDRRFGHGRGH